MNKILSKFARDWLKANLATCTEGQRGVFKRMYSHKNLSCPVDYAVDAMPDDKLDWAMQQVEQTVTKNAANDMATLLNN